LLSHLILACRSRLPLTTREEEDRQQRGRRHRPWQEPPHRCHPPRQDSPPRKTRGRRSHHRCPQQKSRLSSCPPAAHCGRNLMRGGKKEAKAIRGRKERRTGENQSFLSDFGLCVQRCRTVRVRVAHEAGQLDPHGRASTATSISKTTGDALPVMDGGGVYLARNPKGKPCRRLSRAPRPCSPPRTWTGLACPNLNTKGRQVRSGRGLVLQ
jgi:hypothetical protein